MFKLPVRYTISTDKNKLQLNVIHQYLTEESYWAKHIPLEVVERSIENSFCFGVYFSDEQIGFARVITDHAIFAYLADVFILEAHRGKNLSKILMQHIMDHPKLQGLRVFSLRTKDAHGLYKQFGFNVSANPENIMEIKFDNLYQPKSK
ncbi:MAG: GNAT family N-acetyltransferase [Bacteroidia bacterium]